MSNITGIWKQHSVYTVPALPAKQTGFRMWMKPCDWGHLAVLSGPVLLNSISIYHNAVPKAHADSYQQLLAVQAQQM